MIPLGHLGLHFSFAFIRGFLATHSCVPLDNGTQAGKESGKGEMPTREAGRRRERVPSKCIKTNSRQARNISAS